MKRIKSIAIQAPSRPGVLGEIYRALDAEGVTCTALLAPDAMNAGIVHMIPNSLHKAEDALNQLNFPYSFEEALIIDLPDEEGMVGELITTLAIARLNIEFMFTSDMHRIIFATNDIERTEEVLKENFLPKIS